VDKLISLASVADVIDLLPISPLPPPSLFSGLFSRHRHHRSRFFVRRPPPCERTGDLAPESVLQQEAASSSVAASSSAASSHLRCFFICHRRQDLHPWRLKPPGALGAASLRSTWYWPLLIWFSLNCALHCLVFVYEKNYARCSVLVSLDLWICIWPC
jgi:hypothetical protein